MSTLLRWFSPAYRQALQAEAEGRYIEAARHYALCQQPLKVAEMHLLETDSHRSPADALRQLQAAAHFVTEARPSPTARPLVQRIGQACLRLTQQTVLTQHEHPLVGHIAQLLESVGESTTAAALYAAIGAVQAQASALEQAGDIEALEHLHHQQQAGADRQRDADRSLADVQAHLLLGQVPHALAILAPSSASPSLPESLAVFQRALLGRLPSLGALRLQIRFPAWSQGTDVTCAAILPLLLGRGPAPRPPPLRLDSAPPRACWGLSDLDLSRHHAQIEQASPPLDEQGMPQFVLRDLGSKNGTWLNGFRLAAPLPLRGSGEISLGQGVVFAFSIDTSGLSLRCTKGRGMGQALLVSSSPLLLPPSAAGPSLLSLACPPPTYLPCLTLLPAFAPTHTLFLNRRRVPSAIWPLIGDEISIIAGEGPPLFVAEVLP